VTRILAVGSALGAYRYPQAQITEAFGALVVPDPDRRGVLERFHAAAGVRTRHLALPLADYPDLDGFTASNDAFLRIGVELGERAVREALAMAGLVPADIDVIMSVTVTGVGAPSLDARLVPVLGLRDDVRRMPIFGLGCVAGAAGIARLHDYLVGHPDEVGALVSVELCSLTVQRDDRSMANLVASGLFGDGAAAVVAVGAGRPEPGPNVVDSRSHLYPGTEAAMGWDVGGGGLKIVLDSQVPAIVQQYLGGDVRSLLEAHSLSVQDVGAWVSHPGGPKVIEAIEAELGLPGDPLELTWRSLDQIGNLSSASVLHVLRDTLDKRYLTPGTAGMLMAMGPGFCSELVLLRW